MADPARLLDDIAASVADGTDVDWAEPVERLSAHDRRILAHLRVIDSLATVYRTLPPDLDDPADDPLARPEPAGPRWGRLILLDRIGRGTSGDVFRAWDVELQREVALKLLHADGGSDAIANARVLGEARRLARVSHPHVIHVYGAERHEERIGLWMELVSGRTLDDVVRADGPVPAAEAARIGADLCSAVSAVHAAGLLHRDIKAQNVLREEGGRVVLMDFGTGDEIASARPALAGTPLYLAPEILAGAPATPASDVYSLGVLLFHLVSGRYPVQAGSVEGLAAAHRAGRRTSLQDSAPGVPRSFTRIVERALAVDPAQRYASASELEQGLRSFLLPRPALTRPTWRTWTTAAAMVVAATALAATLWRPAGRPATPADATSIAVLPLTYVSGSTDAPYFADGLTDQLITTLGQIRTLRVTALTSVLRFRETKQPISAVASQLGVGSVLEGSIAVQRSGSKADDPKVRVNVRLIRAGTDLELWSDSFERPLSDVLALQADIARAVARSVRATLTRAEDAHLTQRPAASGPAQQAYLEGITYLAQNRRGAEVRTALGALQRATTLDPAFAAPYAALAKSYFLLAGDGEITQDEAYRAGRAAAQRALELDPERADAHAALADVNFYYDWDWAAAEAEYNRAIALDASSAYAHSQLANLLAALGRTEAARQQADQAVAIDPLTADVLLNAGVMAYYQRHYDEARDILRRVIIMDPRFPGAYRTLARIEEARGNITEAINLTDRALRIADYVPARAAALSLRAQAGQQTTARNGLADLQSRLAAEHRTLSAPYEAYVRLSLGERDAALDLLSQAVAARNHDVMWIRVDPRVDPLRADPRFQALLSALGRP